jgi:SAM-dependent methyltransferase
MTHVSTPVHPEASPDAFYEWEQVTCYHCGSSDCEHFIDAVDDYTGYPGTFRFMRCRQCDLVYQNPRIPIDGIKAFYDDAYISHRRTKSWGPLTFLFNRGMAKHDRRKQQLVSRYVNLDSQSRVLDIGCAAGSFLALLQHEFGVHASGVDFIDLSHQPWLQDVAFYHGLFSDQDLPEDSFDLITMWHFLEHDYDPIGTLRTAREQVTRDGRIVIEVPRLDSTTARLFGDRWPGLQAPQHTVLYDKASLHAAVEKAGLEVVDYLPYGAFPPYFYLFAGVAFKILKGKGLNVRKAILPYFLGNFALAPMLLFERQLNLAMQTIVCRRPS